MHFNKLSLHLRGFQEDNLEEMSLNDFLRSRKISEEIILRLEEENVS